MNKLNLIIFIILFFVAPFAARASITISIQSPNTTSPYNGTLSISVSISSTYSMDTVRATVNTKSTLLTSPGGGVFTGTIVLTGLPQGVLPISIYARDALGNTQTTGSTFIYDQPPILNVQSPVNFESYQSKLHIKVTVTDPGHANCKGSAISQNFSISFINSIDTLIDVFPGQTSGEYSLQFSANDSLNQTTLSNVSVSFDKSPVLKQFFKDTGQIISFNGHKALYKILKSDGTPTFTIRNLDDNTNESVVLDKRANSKTTVTGKLSNTGAVFVINYNSLLPYESDSLFVWSNGKLTDINKPLNVQLIASTFSTTGNYLSWYGNGSPATLYLTNLTDLSTIAVDNNNILNTGMGLEPDGTIVYSNTKDIFKYDGVTKTITQITHDDATNTNTNPIIDSNYIAYTKVPIIPAGLFLFLNDGLRDHKLGASATLNTDYELRNGYTAFSSIDHSATNQVWIRRPDTTLKQITFFSTSSSVDRLGNNGRLLINGLNARYYADSLTAPRVVAGLLGGTYFYNNDFYLALGGTIYKYDLSTPPVRPAVSSITPSSAIKGATVTIKGSSLSSTVAVKFGNIPATSFKILSDTVITAVVGVGATGDVSVTNYFGTTALPGFTYIPPPVISSFSPVFAGKGTKIIIKGTAFNNTSAVSIGGVAPSSFTLVSPTEIDAIVDTGTNSSVSVTTPAGTSTVSGFLFVKTPRVTTDGPTFTFQTGHFVNLYASTGSGLVYQWARNGVNISGANVYNYMTNVAGNYTVSLVYGGNIITTSPPVAITEDYSLLFTNFAITITDASCHGSRSGSIAVLARDTSHYTMNVQGNGIDSTFRFSKTVHVSNLAAGTYSVCFGVEGHSDYKQCSTVVVNEPKDLSVFSSVDQTTGMVNLSLTGGTLYTIVLNGISYTTTQSELTLNLKKGDNTLNISTDKLCQGIVRKHINFGNTVLLYPNPVDNLLNITLGQTTSKSAKVEVRTIDGNVVFKGSYINEFGSIQVDLSSLKSGIHVLKLSLDDSESVFKLIKK